MRTTILSFFVLAAALPGLSAADNATQFKVSEFTFTRPAKWPALEIDPAMASMRKAQLRVPGENGAEGEVVFYYFGQGQGGNAQANVQRWFGQFQEQPTESN